MITVNNNRLEVPYSVRIQETKDRLRAKRAQMEKNVHIRSKVINVNGRENLQTNHNLQPNQNLQTSQNLQAEQNVQANQKQNTNQMNGTARQSVKKLTYEVKNYTTSEEERRTRLQQMVVMSEILSKPVSMRKRHRKRGNS